MQYSTAKLQCIHFHKNNYKYTETQLMLNIKNKAWAGEKPHWLKLLPYRAKDWS